MADERCELEAAGWEPRGEGAQSDLAQTRRRMLVRSLPGPGYAAQGSTRHP